MSDRPRRSTRVSISTRAFARCGGVVDRQRTRSSRRIVHCVQAGAQDDRSQIAAVRPARDRPARDRCKPRSGGGLHRRPRAGAQWRCRDRSGWSRESPVSAWAGERRGGAGLCKGVLSAIGEIRLGASRGRAPYRRGDLWSCRLSGAAVGSGCRERLSRAIVLSSGPKRSSGGGRRAALHRPAVWRLGQ